MRRELSLVGMSLVAYACALVLGSLIICVGLSLLQDFRTGLERRGECKTNLQSGERTHVSCVAQTSHRITRAPPHTSVVALARGS